MGSQSIQWHLAAEPAADPDPQESAEWRSALASVLQAAGPARVRQLLDMLAETARDPAIGWQPAPGTPYVNTIPVERQPAFPGDLALEERLASLMRWNALAMVVRANQAYGELGGHIASYASAADLFEVGFNHFFRARSGADSSGAGDLVFYQPHSAPGVYARAFLEGRLTETDLAHYRQEIAARRVGAQGLSSYPHPWLMPGFWQFPTGSMGIGPISSIFQARFMRYLQHRGLVDSSDRRVWGVFGDGEMDEPESMSALTLAAREGLDNLVWVVNCNLQRLDGPVRGNGRIIDELEALFGGAGWHVIKLVWGSDWDGLFARDTNGALVKAFAQTVDGQLQTFAAKDGRYNRMLTNLLKDPRLGPRIVPIVADEARTFGMANLFKQVGIYSSVGQHYEPEDIGSVLSYREAKDGQILEEGISEASAISSWVAAATSYSVHGTAMLPFYIYYSMFGFQRVGDLIWAAADQRARGFLLGATAGRTTLGGEGLQHQDGGSHVIAATIPNCRAYDPAFAGEFAVILDHGMRQMLERQEDVFYYVTLMNENYAQPSLPEGVAPDIVKGLYRYAAHDAPNAQRRVRLLGSGTILREVIAAAELLQQDWQVASEVWSATSYSELARDAREVERWNRLHPEQPARTSHLQACLGGGSGVSGGALPVIAASDYVRAWPQLIANHAGAPFTVLGTDGFGRSDTRAELRRFFEVDRHQIVLAALDALVRSNQLAPQACAEAIRRYGIATDGAAPWAR